jgi:hypothetical protein
MAKLDRFEVDPAKAASHFERLPIVVRDILRLCDGRRTIESICASSPLGGDETQKVLERLSALGLVSLRSRGRSRRTASTPVISAWLDGNAPPRRRPRTRRPAAFAPPPAITLPAAAELPTASLVVEQVVAPEPLPAPRVTPAVTAAAQVLTIDLTATDFSADEERFFASSIDHLVED